MATEIIPGIDNTPEESNGSGGSLLWREPPRPVPLRRGIGSGFLWASVAMGSAELIWQPYLTAKYAGHFLGWVLVAAVLSLFVNQAVARYTVLTGETILVGFFRVSKSFFWLLALGLVPTFLWFGGNASAGGSSLASLTNFPQGWSSEAQTVFWGYALICLFLIPVIAGRVVYVWIERVMLTIAVGCLFGFLLASIRHEVFANLPGFLIKIFTPRASLPATWSPADAEVLITSVGFLGLGGYYTLMYSYWVRDKGLGMGGLVGRVTSPLRGPAENVGARGFGPVDSVESQASIRRWLEILWADNAMGVGMNLLTVLLTTSLAMAILTPERVSSIPGGWQLISFQADFFASQWGRWAGVALLSAASLFLADTWLGAADGVSRMVADIIYTRSAASRRRTFRWYYYAAFIGLLAISLVTLPLKSPGTLLLLSGVCNFMAMALYVPVLTYLTVFYVPRLLPAWTRPSLPEVAGLIGASLAYLGLAAWYVAVLLGR